MCRNGALIDYWHVIEKSAYDALAKQLEEYKWHWDRLASQVMPGTNDTTETMIAIMKERDSLKEEVARFRDLHERDAVIVDMRARDSLKAQTEMLEKTVKWYANGYTSSGFHRMAEITLDALAVMRKGKL